MVLRRRKGWDENEARHNQDMGICGGYFCKTAW
jgi:hypothetical protein